MPCNEAVARRAKFWNKASRRNRTNDIRSTSRRTRHDQLGKNHFLYKAQ